jgi:hypothetical protein
MLSSNDREFDGSKILLRIDFVVLKGGSTEATIKSGITKSHVASLTP